MADAELRSFAWFAEKLKTRTIPDITNLHFVEKDGTFKCLDVNISAPDLTELRRQVAAYLEFYPDNLVLPSAPLNEWQESWNHHMEWRRVLPEIFAVLKSPVGATLVRL